MKDSDHRLWEHEIPSPTKRLWLRYRWQAMLAVGALGLLLSLVGFLQVVVAETPATSTFLPQFNNFLTALYKALVGFWFNALDAPVTWTVQAGRFLTMIAAVFVGSQFLLEILHHERLRTRARWFKEHVVVCGAGELGAAAASALVSQGERVVLVDVAENVATAALTRQGSAVVVGNAADPTTLLEAGIDRAKVVLVCCGGDDRNATVASAVRRVLDALPERTDRRPTTVRVHVQDPALLRQLRPYALHLSHAGDGANDMDFFNLAEITAESLVARRRTPQVGAPNDEYDTVILGNGPLAASIAIASARAAVLQDPDAKARILLCGREADVLRQSLVGFLSGIEHGVELTADTTDLDLVEPGSHPGLFSAGAPLFSEAYVCTTDDVDTMRLTLALTAAIAVPPHPPELCVWACIYGASGIAAIVSSVQDGLMEVVDATESLTMGSKSIGQLDTIETLARIVHNNYLESERKKSSDKRTVAFGSWDDLAEAYKEANRDQVREFVSRLSDEGMRLVPIVEWAPEPFLFTDEEVEELAILEHKRWFKQKEDQGYRPGPSGRREEMIHECLVDWAELPGVDPDGQQKDRDTIINMPAVLAAAGMRPVRVAEYRKG